MDILITAVITFAITGGWQLLATRKIRANQRLTAKGIICELNEMAVKLGHQDFLEYLAATKGKEYAVVAGTNLKSFCDSFTAKGAD